jgi:hypothetical protein
MGKAAYYLIASSLLLLLLGCSAQRETLRTFPDIQALESQVRNYRDWLQAKELELSSLKQALDPHLARFLKGNLYLYDAFKGQLAVMDTVYATIKTLAREQKRRILPLQKSGASSRSRSFSTITTDFSKVDLEIRKRQRSYMSAREEIVSLLKKRNLQTIFISEQVRRWRETIIDLQERRMHLQPRYEKLMDLAVGELAMGEEASSTRKLSEILNRAESYQKNLDRLEHFFKQLEQQAIHEMEGSVYIRGIGSEPPEYEKRAIRSQEKYRSILAELEQLLPEI